MALMTAVGDSLPGKLSQPLAIEVANHRLRPVFEQPASVLGSPGEVEVASASDPKPAEIFEGGPSNQHVGRHRSRAWASRYVMGNPFAATAACPASEKRILFANALDLPGDDAGLRCRGRREEAVDQIGRRAAVCIDKQQPLTTGLLSPGVSGA